MLAEQRGNERNRPRLIRAEIALLQADADQRGGGALRAIQFAERFQLCLRNAGHPLDPFRRPLHRFGLQCVETARPVLQKILVNCLPPNQMRHDAIRQRDIRAGARLQPYIGLLRGFAAARVNHDDFRAMLLPRFSRQRELMRRTDGGVESPEHNQPLFSEFMRKDAGAPAVMQANAAMSGFGAYRMIGLRRAERIPEAARKRLGNQSAISGIIEIQQRFRAKFFYRLAKARGNDIERGFPINRRKFCSFSEKRLRDAIRYQPLAVFCATRTGEALRQRMFRIAIDRCYLPGGVERDGQRTGVIAIAGAGGGDGFHGL